jgi:hypothetical protein
MATSRANAFHRVFRLWGGQLDLDLVQPSLRKLMTDWRTGLSQIIADEGSAASFPPGPLTIDYVDNPTINAIDARDAGHEMIGFFAGSTGFVLHSLTALALLPTAFGGNGSTLEGDSPSNIRRLIEQQPTGHYLDFPGRPDKARTAIVHAATTIAHLFLFGHEVGHHVFGHLWYLERELGSDTLAEHPTELSTAAPIELRRLIEFDADMHGAAVSLVAWMRISRRWHEVDLDPFFLWVYSLGMLMRLFDLRRPDDDTSEPHPRADIRFANIYVRGLEEVIARQPEAKETFSSKTGEAIRALRRDWATLSLPAGSFTEDRERHIAAEVAGLRRLWEELKDNTLDPIAFERAETIRALETT